MVGLAAAVTALKQADVASTTSSTEVSSEVVDHHPWPSMEAAASSEAWAAHASVRSHQLEASCPSDEEAHP